MLWQRIGLLTNVAVWRHSDGTSVDNVWSNRYRLESGWGDTEQLSAGAPSCHAPEVAVSTAGDAVVVWVQQQDQVSQLWSNRYTPGFGWGAPEFLDVTSLGHSKPGHVGIDGEGNAIAVWSHTELVPWSIWANHSSRPK